MNVGDRVDVTVGEDGIFWGEMVWRGTVIGFEPGVVLIRFDRSADQVDRVYLGRDDIRVLDAVALLAEIERRWPEP